MRQAKTMRYPRAADLTFRRKILLSLVGTVVLLVGTSLLAVRHQTQKQVEEQVELAMRRSGRAFAEVEAMRNEELERYGRRFSGSIRLPAAMDAALDAGDPSIVAEAAEYELALAGLDRGLVVFSDADAAEVVALHDGAYDPGARDADLEGPVLELLQSDEPRLTGYDLADDVLFTIHVYPLVLVDRLVGALTLGFPFADEEARRLGEVVGAEICFAVASRCVAKTAGFDEPGLGGMVGSVDSEETVIGTWDDARWALVSEPLAGGTSADVRQIIAVPLDAILLPFDRIERAERTVGLAALALALLLGAVLSRGLANPVQRLVAATERVRRGEYDFRIAVSSRDELGQLGEAFNGMVGDLALKERYRGILDKVVSADVAAEMLKGEIRLGGETREVSTLFADVRGFTSLSERLGPQEVVAALNEWFDLASAAVEGEGGVVDKFLGDGLMAIFGAPIAQDDHALRAVRAALRMRRGLETLNRRREERGELPLPVGIGICTGSVVAGNTGSQKRLNYTVLGEAVNLAARLCSEAGASEILISDSTRQLLAGQVETRGQAPRRVKGVSREVRPWLVRGLIATAAGLLPLVLALPAAAQELLPDTPTLQELGIEYISPSGFLQLSPSGRLDIAYHRPGNGPPGLIAETEPFMAVHLRLFVDAFLGDRFYASTELRADRGDEPSAGRLTGRVQQAFARLSLTDDGTLHLQAGKFITPFGDHPGRRRTGADPFIRPPLHHEYRTVMGTERVPGDVDGFLGWKDRPEEIRHNGVPAVWGTPYPTGAMLLGGRGPVSFRLAVLNSAPSSEPDQWDPSADGFRDPSWVANVGYQALRELRVGASFATGPYLRRGIEDPLAQPGSFTPADRFRSFDQQLLGLDLAYTRGMIELRGEVVRDAWQLPNVADDAVDISWFVEAKAKTRGGLYGAARLGAVHFGDITAGSGRAEAWDYDVRRWQVAGGYRLSRNMELRAEYLRDHTSSPFESGTDLASLELWWRF